jgi:murein DD-endopeptidase MepM/ murein hydrolase activator NlpD
MGQEETPIRAIADGVVRQVFDPGVYGSYNVFIHVEHGETNTNMFSSYYHVKPLVDEGQEVRKGDVISALHKDSGNEKGLLVHLHFSLCNAWDIRPRDVDPLEILPEFELLYAEPQGRKRFMVKGLNQQPEVHIANFDELLLDEK